MDLSLLVEEALCIPSSGFIETVDRAASLLHCESGRVGNLTIINPLVKLEPLGEALVIGDLQGDLESLIVILQKSRFMEKMEKTKEAVLIFLGDYGDREDKSAEIYYMILKFKLAFLGQVVLLRGNHKAPRDLLGYPHDLPEQFKYRFGDDWEVAYEKTRALCAYFHNAVFVKDRYLMVHGGVSPEISSLQDIAEAREKGNEALLEELLWSDPDEDVQDVSFSPWVQGSFLAKESRKRFLEN